MSARQDGELIEACEHCLNQWHREQAIPAGLTGKSPAREWSLRRNITAMLATTPTGMQAKARVLVCLDGEDASLARSIAHDLTTGQAAVINNVQ
jgi:hypothetical protein